MKSWKLKGWLPWWEIKPQTFDQRPLSGVTTVLSFRNVSLTTSLKRLEIQANQWENLLVDGSFQD